MRPPGGPIGKPGLSLRRQPADHRPGKGAITHVIQRRRVDAKSARRIDDVVAVTRAQQVEEVQPALAVDGGVNPRLSGDLAI